MKIVISLMVADSNFVEYLPDQLKMLFGNILNVAANLEDVAIKINSYSSNYIYCYSGLLLQTILSHYTKQFVVQSLKVFGSLDVLGDPFGLVRNIGIGIKDLFYEPIIGLSKSPAAFAKGIQKGTASFTKRTTNGVLGSVSKMTLSFGNTFHILTNDKRTSSPQSKTLKSGLENGGKALFEGVVGGIAGVFMDPADV